MDIFQILIALPGIFKLSDLFDTNIEKTYTFKGFIGVQAEHNLAFFRRIPIKLDSFINPVDSNKAWYHHKVHRETAESEWTLFDDAKVTNYGGWTNVINHCTELQCYPTVLFFERVDE